jgi:hypothetical protein
LSTAGTPNDSGEPERAELTIQRTQRRYRLKLSYAKLAALAERPLVRG